MAEPFIARLLKPSQIILQVTAQDRDGVIRELASSIEEFKNNPSELETFIAALLERERLHSTGIGDGVALPHARNQQSTLLPRPVLAFGRHDKGIPFGSVDGKPVFNFFLMSAPAMTLHLQMLAVLSRILRNASLRSELGRTDSPQKIIDLIAEAERALPR